MQLPDGLQDKSSAILTAISTAMRKEETNNAIKLAATQALGNALESVRKNFEREADRNAMMTMVFNAAQSDDVKVRVASYQCLVEIATLYYAHIGKYMEAIFTVSLSPGSLCSPCCCVAIKRMQQTLTGCWLLFVCGR